MDNKRYYAQLGIVAILCAMALCVASMIVNQDVCEFDVPAYRVINTLERIK